MSRATRVAGALASAAALAAPSGLAAQQTEAELLAHIDSLGPLVEEADRDLTRALEAIDERVRRSMAGTIDSFRIAGATVVTPVEDARYARALFLESWADHFGIVEGDALRGWTFTFQAGADHRTLPARRPLARDIVMAPWQTRTRAKQHIGSALADAIAHRLSTTTVGAWGGADALRAHDATEIYRELATTASRSVRSCLAGDDRACLHSLELGDLPNAMEVWYSRDELRNKVMEAHIHPAFGFERESYDSCAYEADLAACDELIGEVRWPPLSAGARSSVVRYALEQGGHGAWARLLESGSAPPEEALPYVAGKELSELISEWRIWLIGNRPVSYAGIGGKSVVAVLWILLFTSLATRSTRWRLG